MMKYFVAFVLLIASFLEGKALEHKRVLVTGCGRSGTGYMCVFLKASGLDVHHEYMGADGSVSWLMGATVDEAPWGPLSKDFHFDHIFHQVRNPIKVIQSFYNVPMRATWEWIGRCLPQIKADDPLLTKCAKYWVYWNKMVAKKAEWTFRIEDFDDDYQELGRRLGIELKPEVLQKIGKKTNSKGPPQRVITWKILKEELDPETYREVVKLARHYKYPTKD